MAQQQPRVTETATREPTRPTRTLVPTQTPTEFVPTAPPPTEAPPPTAPPPPTEMPPPTETLAPTRKPLPTKSPTPAPPTATPAPTRCPQKYCVVYRGCTQDTGNIIVEGIVYNNGVPENGVVVRASNAQGAYPIVEFVSGNDPINPGKPDPNNPGRFFLQIVAGAPQEGHWWIFAVDVPNGTKQISEAKEIHTHDDPFNPVNCQHAFVDFVR